MNTENEFFDDKRPWSKIKDQVLGGYLVPYVSKVKNLGRKIILVDCFAGPGKFKDGTSGSPLMMCQIGHKQVPNQFVAILVNKNRKHHASLSHILSEFIERREAIVTNEDAISLLERLKSLISNQTLFIYLDPFGLKGTNFQNILPFLSRDKTFSSEIIINISVPTIHRLSLKNKIMKGETLDNRLLKCQDGLSAALGGDYWKKYLFDTNLSPTEQIDEIMKEYKNLLRNYLPIVCSCPVHESTEQSIVKYYIVSASRHIDTAKLLNNIMFKSYWQHIWSSTTEGTLFQGTDWHSGLPNNYYVAIDHRVVSILKDKPISRAEIWRRIILEDFMKYDEADFRKRIGELVKQQKLTFIDVRGTGKLNDDSILSLKSN